MSYRVHKWIGVTVGVFLLIWLISGVVMVLPELSFAPTNRPMPALFDLQGINMSPAKAVADLVGERGKPVRVKSLNLLRIRDTVVYHIVSEDGASELIDTKSGRRFEITSGIAEQIVRDTFPIQGSILPVERVTQHDLSYAWGPLPVYRIVFGDSHDTHYHVSISDGTVQRSNRWSRILIAVERLHTFQPLKLFFQDDAVRRGLLVLLSLVGVGVAATGYYLALSRRLR